MKRFLSVFVYLCFFISGEAFCESLKIGAAVYPPYITGDKDNYGIFELAVKELFSDSSLEPTFVYRPFARGLKDFESGKIDGVILTDISLSALGLDDKDLIKKHLTAIYAQIYYNNDKFSKDFLDNKKVVDLCKYKFGIIINSPYKKILSEQGCKFIELESMESSFQMLIKKRIDFFPMPREIASASIEKLDPKQRKMIGESKGNYFEDKVFLLLKKNKKFENKLDKILDK